MKNLIVVFLILSCLFITVACSSSVGDGFPIEDEDAAEPPKAVPEYIIHFEPNLDANSRLFGTMTDLTVKQGETFTFTTGTCYTTKTDNPTYKRYPIALTASKIGLTDKALTLNAEITLDEELAGYADNNKMITITVTFDTNCIAKGTMITMADGSKKAVENINLNDQILTYNFFTGAFEPKKVILIEKGYGSSVFSMTVSTDIGKSLEIISYHSLFNQQTKQYLDMGYYNYEQMTGKKILVENNETFETATITSVDVCKKNCEYYCLITEDNLNCFAGDFLTVIPTWFSYIPFEINDNYIVDAAKMNQDINDYGIYSYQDYPFEVSESLFNKLMLKYSKIIEAKGLATLSQLGQEIDYLSSTFDGWN